jgi:hypothetical protein
LAAVVEKVVVDPGRFLAEHEVSVALRGATGSAFAGRLANWPSRHSSTALSLPAKKCSRQARRRVLPLEVLGSEPAWINATA